MNQGFRLHQVKRGYAESTLKTQDHHVKCFLSWCTEQGIDPKEISYNEAVGFIDYLRGRNIQSVTVRGILNTLKIYYDYLVENKCQKHNLFKQMKIQGNGKKVLPTLFSTQQLEAIYQNFSSVPTWRISTPMEELLHQRNTVMVGLLVYQGLDSGEMARIEITHIHLKEGSIFNPSGRRSNGRTLKLKADQILPFKTYLQETRPHLLVKRNTNTVFLFPVKKYSDMICNGCSW